MRLSPFLVRVVRASFSIEMRGKVCSRDERRWGSGRRDLRPTRGRAWATAPCSNGNARAWAQLASEAADKVHQPLPWAPEDEGRVRRRATMLTGSCFWPRGSQNGDCTWYLCSPATLVIDGGVCGCRTSINPASVFFRRWKPKCSKKGWYAFISTTTHTRSTRFWLSYSQWRKRPSSPNTRHRSGAVGLWTRMLELECFGLRFPTLYLLLSLSRGAKRSSSILWSFRYWCFCLHRWQFHLVSPIVSSWTGQIALKRRALENRQAQDRRKLHESLTDFRLREERKRTKTIEKWEDEGR